MEAIRSDERTRELTLGFRQHRLDSLKNESMLFAVPCIFEGGKAQKHVVRLTGVSMVDFDHADQLTIENGKQKIIADPHTLLSPPSAARGCGCCIGMSWTKGLS